MKQLLLTTIAAVLVVGCGPRMDIHEAAEKGNINAVKKQLAAGVDVNEMMIVGMSPLQIASGEGHREIVELLITEGADVKAKDSFIGRTALGHASMDGHKEIAELLITNGASVTAMDNIGSTPLHSAAEGGHKEIVALLVANGGECERKRRGRMDSIAQGENQGSRRDAHRQRGGRQRGNERWHDSFASCGSLWFQGSRRTTHRKRCGRECAG